MGAFKPEARAIGVEAVSVGTERPGIIYLAVNRVNQKAYVGLTAKSLRERFVVHIQKARLGYRSLFYSAIRKYGIDSFDVAVLQECHGGLNEMALAEREWIVTLGSKAPNGYNIADGGQGGSGIPKTDAWRASVTSMEVREKHRQRAIRWRAGMTTEQRESHQSKISAKAKGRPNYKLRGSGNPACNPDVKPKISEGQRLAWADPARKSKRLEANRIAREKREKGEK